MFNKRLAFLLKKVPESNRWERVWKLAQIDFRRRYFNTRLGLLWAFINPVFRLFVYLFVFSWLGRMRREGFGFYIFSALIVWLAFAESSNKGAAILRSKKYLIQNIEFKKIDLFTSSTISVFMGLTFNLTAYLVISFLSGNSIYLEILWLPILLANLFVLCMGISMILSVIDIYAKDINHLWQMLLMLGFWTIPAIFPLEYFTGFLEIFLWANPVAGIIINLRKATLYGEVLDYYFLLHCWIYALIIFYAGKYLIEKHWVRFIELS